MSFLKNFLHSDENEVSVVGKIGQVVKNKFKRKMVMDETVITNQSEEQAKRAKNCNVSKEKIEDNNLEVLQETKEDSTTHAKILTETLKEFKNQFEPCTKLKAIDVIDEEENNDLLEKDSEDVNVFRKSNHVVDAAHFKLREEIYSGKINKEENLPKVESKDTLEEILTLKKEMKDIKKAHFESLSRIKVLEEKIEGIEKQNVSKLREEIKDLEKKMADLSFELKSYREITKEEKTNKVKEEKALFGKEFENVKESYEKNVSYFEQKAMCDSFLSSKSSKSALSSVSRQSNIGSVAGKTPSFYNRVGKDVGENVKEISTETNLVNTVENKEDHTNPFLANEKGVSSLKKTDGLPENVRSLNEKKSEETEKLSQKSNDVKVSQQNKTEVHFNNPQKTIDSSVSLGSSPNSETQTASVNDSLNTSQNSYPPNCRKAKGGPKSMRKRSSTDDEFLDVNKIIGTQKEKTDGNSKTLKAKQQKEESLIVNLCSSESETNTLKNSIPNSQKNFVELNKDLSKYQRKDKSMK